MAKKKAAKRPAKKTALESAKSGRKKTAKRRGRPPKGCSPVTPQIVEQIARAWLRGASHTAIAADVKLAKSTVQKVIDEQLKPLWAQGLEDELEVDLQKVREIEREVWEVFSRSKDPADLLLARWAIEHRAKIAGHYAAKQIDVQGVDQLRVAGLSPDQFDLQTVKILLEEIDRRAAYQEALRRRMAEETDG